MSIWLLYLLLLRATVTSFSGFASVPVIREDLVVQRAVLRDEQLNAALAISQTSPGPLGLYVVIVGYFVAGVPGAVAGMAALATPAVLALPLLALVRRGNADLIRGASSGIVLASAVLMALAALRLAPGALSRPSLMILALLGFAVLASGRFSPLIVVAAGAALAFVIG